jgi:hypothetical protein
LEEGEICNTNNAAQAGLRRRFRHCLILSREFSSVGNMMGALAGGNRCLRFEGHFARLTHESLYKTYELAPHGFWRTHSRGRSRSAPSRT